MTCERRTPSTVIHCSASPDVETAARDERDPEGASPRRGERGDRHRPRRLPGRRIAGGDVAADRHQRRADAVRAQDAQRLLGGVALGDAAGVDLDARPRRASTVRRRGSSRTLAKPPAARAAATRSRLGPGVQAAGPPPQVREAAGGDVEGAAGAPRQRVGRREHGEQIVADGHGDAGGRARQRRHLAVVAVVAEARVDRGDARERRLRGRLAGRARTRRRATMRTSVPMWGALVSIAAATATAARLSGSSGRVAPAPMAGQRHGARAERRREPARLTRSRPASAPAASASAPSRASSGIRLGIASACSQVTRRPVGGFAAEDPGQRALGDLLQLVERLAGADALDEVRVLVDVGVVDLALERPRVLAGDVELRQDEGAALRCRRPRWRPSCRCRPAGA